MKPWHRKNPDAYPEPTGFDVIRWAQANFAGRCIVHKTDRHLCRCGFSVCTYCDHECPKKDNPKPKRSKDV